ncbi:MAG: sensor histidine kinase [Pseudomonadota bacterium]
MTGAASLRLRLFCVILTPLILMALILGYWRFTVAEQTAEQLFDRSLLAAGIAISKDLAFSGGDALASTTRDLIAGTAGGEVFYHATGPGGIYVTGYAYPPTAPGATLPTLGTPEFFEATYRGEAVRVSRVGEQVTIDGLSGVSAVTVWQRTSDRRAFANELALRALILMGGLLVTLALVVWYGVSLGLRPLTNLQDAIAARSPDDLGRIQRAVPEEVRGIVETLNRLFAQVETSIEAHKVFISDAAHQLRNPAAAVQSMAAAVRDAKTPEDQAERLAQLQNAARRSARISDQLLSLDRLQSHQGKVNADTFDLGAALEELCSEVAAKALLSDLDFEFERPKTPIIIEGDKLLIEEATSNLIDNAMKHGGSKLSFVKVTLERTEDAASITVSDDGVGLSPEDSESAFRRFSQVRPSDGSGLGLAIVTSVAEKHGGSVAINPQKDGASITMTLSVT